MSRKPSLYELLDVPPTANSVDIRVAYQRQLALAEADAALSADQRAQRLQLLRIAYSTLGDAASRLTYDAKLAAEPATGQAGAAGGGAALTLAAKPAQAVDEPVAHLRAEALSLKAEALSLKADAIMMRAGYASGASAPGLPAAPLAFGLDTGVASGSDPLDRFAARSGSLFRSALNVVGLLLLVLLAIGLVAGWSGRAKAPALDAAHEAAQQAARTKEAEQLALKEYQKTYGVLPASMAEMELMEADRRRRENEARSARQDAEKRERDAKRFEEESRRRSQEVSARLQATEEQAAREARYAAEREAREAQYQRDREDALKRQKELDERYRIERQRAEWNQILRR